MPQKKDLRPKSNQWTFVLVFFRCALRPANAAELGFSYTDSIGESGVSIDVSGLDFVFEKSSGAYTIHVFATAAKPFLGNFRINVNLFNPDTGTSAPNPSFFLDTVNDFTLTSPTTSQTLTGMNSRLLSWDLGDRVAIGSAGLGNPTGTTAFGSGVYLLPFSTSVPLDIIGSSSPLNGSAAAIATIGTVGSVPEPASIELLSFAMAVFFLFHRENRPDLGGSTVFGNLRS